MAHKSSLLFISILSLAIVSEGLVCPDTSQCRDGMTCCKWSTGKYGCCPLASAQCCTDGLHCCPSGTKCNDKEGTCDQIVEPKFRIVRINASSNALANTVCPGGEYQCPDDNTCCQMAGGVWGCCPLRNAVCCADKIHCCPSGERCGPTGCAAISN